MAKRSGFNFQHIIEETRIVSFEECRNAHVNTMLLKGSSEHTLKGFQVTLKRLESLLAETNPEAIKDMGKFSKDDAIDFCNQMREDNLAISSYNSHLKRMKAFFAFLKRNKYVKENYFQSIPTKRDMKEVKYVVTKKDIDAICKVLNLDRMDDVTTYVIIQIMTKTGCRIGEVSNIRVQDIKDNFDKLLIRGKKTYTERMVIIPDSLKPILKGYLEIRGNLDHDNLLFNIHGGKLHVNSANRKIHQAAIKANLPQITSHSFRRYYITTLVNSGANLHLVAKLVGHNNLNQLRQYLEVDINTSRDLLDKL